MHFWNWSLGPAHSPMGIVPETTVNCHRQLKLTLLRISCISSNKTNFMFQNVWKMCQEWFFKLDKFTRPTFRRFTGLHSTRGGSTTTGGEGITPRRLLTKKIETPGRSKVGFVTQFPAVRCCLYHLLIAYYLMGSLLDSHVVIPCRNRWTQWTVCSASCNIHSTTCLLWILAVRCSTFTFYMVVFNSN